jgi:D-alanine transaminase
MDDPLARCRLARSLSRADRAEWRTRRLYIYVQVTRGAEFGPQPRAAARRAAHRVRVRAPWPTARAGWLEKRLPAITADDTRWARCDIKSVSLLANVLLRQLAVDGTRTETILLRDGLLTDASASSVHVVIGGELRTPPNSWQLLPGRRAA